MLKPTSFFMDQENNYNDDIFFLILVSLPAGEAYKFRLVCKSWYYIIKSSSFIQSHLHKSKPGLICNRENGVDNKLYDDKISIREFNENSTTIWGSCNGLVLLDQFVQTVGKPFLFLANPVTHEVMKLPSPHHHNDGRFSNIFGITYVDSIKKYVLVHYFVRKEGHKNSGDLLSLLGCETLTVGDDEWKLVYFAQTNTGLEFFWSRKVIFINNVAHVVVLEQIESFTSYLVSLDMNDMNYYKTRMPDHHRDIFDIGGVLSFACLCQDTVFEIWSLEDFRTEDWVMHTRIETGVNGFVGSVVATLGKTLIATYYDFGVTRRDDVGYFTYDIQLEKTQYLDFKPRQTGCKMVPHVESLVSWKESYNQGEMSGINSSSLTPEVSSK